MCVGTVTRWSSEAEYCDAFFMFDDFTSPPTMYRVNIPEFVIEFGAKGLEELEKNGCDSMVKIWQADVIDCDADDFETVQEFYNSSDGTPIPMFFIRKKDRPFPAPTLLYGYGGFNISVMPSFRSIRSLSLSLSLLLSLSSSYSSRLLRE